VWEQGRRKKRDAGNQVVSRQKERTGSSVPKPQGKKRTRKKKKKRARKQAQLSKGGRKTKPSKNWPPEKRPQKILGGGGRTKGQGRRTGGVVKGREGRVSVGQRKIRREE